MQGLRVVLGPLQEHARGQMRNHQERGQVMVEGDNNTGTVASSGRFRVEGCAFNPAERDDNRREIIADYQPKTAALTRARDFHRRGLWVEVFHIDTGELRAGPLDPDAPFPQLFIGS